MPNIPDPPDYGDIPPPGDDDIDHSEHFGASFTGDDDIEHHKRLAAQERHEMADDEHLALMDDDVSVPGLVTPEQVTTMHFALSRLPTVPTNFKALDGLLDGMRPTQPYVLAAATGQGKTSFMLQLVLQYPGPAFIWSREMAPWQLQSRMVAQISRMDSNAILRGNMDDRRYTLHVSSFKHRVWYYDGGREDFEYAVGHVARAANARGLDRPLLLVIDYLQKLAPATDRLREAITEVSEMLRHATQKHQLVTWIVSAVGREAARRIRDQRNLHPGDLVDVARESGSIEYDCAAMLVLGLDPEDADGQRTAVISVAKNRYGREGQVEFHFIGETGRFKEIGLLESKAQRDRRELRDSILVFVRQADEPPMKKSICKYIGKRKQAVLQEIDAMVRDGELAKVGRGYRLGPNAPDDEPAESDE